MGATSYDPLGQMTPEQRIQFLERELVAYQTAMHMAALVIARDRAGLESRSVIEAMFGRKEIPAAMCATVVEAWDRLTHAVIEQRKRFRNV